MKILTLILLIVMLGCSTSTFTSRTADVAGSAGDDVGAAGSSTTATAATGGSDLGSGVGGASNIIVGTAGSSQATGGATGVGGTTISTSASSTGGTGVAGSSSATGGAIGKGGAPGTGGTTTSTSAASMGGTGVAGAPTSLGPTMVQINGHYWIDSTEVTNQQYMAWIATNPIPAQPTECLWNTDLKPDSSVVADQPVSGVDWCDALAYCTSVGKRLCGSMTGGTTPVADVNTLSDEWYDACTSGGKNTFANGNLASEAVYSCNVNNRIGSTTSAGSLTACTSNVAGYTGVYDLTGNIAEWTNSCDSTADTCATRGASYARSVWTCSMTDYVKRNLRNPTVGIRCCRGQND